MWFDLTCIRRYYTTRNVKFPIYRTKAETKRSESIYRYIFSRINTVPYQTSLAVHQLFFRRKKVSSFLLLKETFVDKIGFSVNTRIDVTRRSWATHFKKIKSRPKNKLVKSTFLSKRSSWVKSLLHAFKNQDFCLVLIIRLNIDIGQRPANVFILKVNKQHSMRNCDNETKTNT